jgi:hypothetical protein
MLDADDVEGAAGRLLRRKERASLAPLPILLRSDRARTCSEAGPAIEASSALWPLAPSTVGEVLGEDPRVLAVLRIALVADDEPLPAAFTRRLLGGPSSAPEVSCGLGLLRLRPVREDELASE